MTINFEEIEKKRKELERRSGGGILDIKIGWNYMFLLPPFNQDGDIWVEVWRHMFYVCPKKYNGSRCLICEELEKPTRKNDKEFLKKYSLQPRAFLNVILRQDLQEGNIQILSPSAKSFRDIVEYICDERCDPTDPKNSLLLGIKKTVVRGKTTYETRFGKSTDISSFLTDSLLKNIPNLTKHPFLQPATQKELAEELAKNGVTVGDDPIDFGDAPPIDDSSFKEPMRKTINKIDDSSTIKPDQLQLKKDEEIFVPNCVEIDRHALTDEEKAFVEAKIKEMRTKK